MRALYRLKEGCSPPENKGNVGLWYDKYCDKWQLLHPDSPGLPYWSLGEKKSEWIKSVTERSNNSTLAHTDEDTLKRDLEEMCQRRESLATTVWDTMPRVLLTDGRFVTGMGRQHPVENGMAWHHTLGVPYLPGSSIKGVIRGWIEQWEAQENASLLKEAERIFGPRDTTDTGSITVLDALPTGPVDMKIDIMTPHYAPWYAEHKAPGDWYDPIPIPFLTVAADQEFQFIIAPRKPGRDSDRKDADAAMKWLINALTWIGAGAKTAVGYGRFKEPAAKMNAATILWEGAALLYDPGPGTLTATHAGKRAIGKNDELTAWIKEKRKTTSGKKKLSKGNIKATVEVEARGNEIILRRIIDQS